MPKINILPKEVVEKIAAGEVVEKPASVVKELVENSIDAEAKKIIVQFFEGGMKEIMVKDDGIGMSREDAILAFKRHATSKIRTVEDLEKISTLGFRGEALASIAAVSKVELITRTREDIVGTKVTIEGGEIKKVESVSASPGTTIYVRDLFYNTPARKKFLRDRAQETSEIIEVVRKYALCYPSIHFVLKNENQEILNAPPSDELSNIAYVFGLDTAKKMVKVEIYEEPIKVEGYISKPEKTVGNRSHMYIYVNGRYVKDEMLYEAVLAGYKNLLFRKRYPYCIIKISLPPELVDVNVHPSKIFVRFYDEEKIYRIIEKGVWNSLRSLQQDLTDSSIIASLDKASPAANQTKIYQSKISEILTESTKLKERAPERIEEFFTEYRFPPLEILGQLKDTYIIAKSDEYLVIIDQHAAHERINYEKLLRNIKKKEFQVLISPIILQLPQSELHELLEYREILEEVGFKIEEYGKNSVAIREIPIGLTVDIENFLRELITELKRKRFSTKQELLDDIIKNIACKGSIKSNEPLSELKIRTIISELRKCENPFSCPHGRPTMILLSKEKLEKMFKRT